MFNYVVFAPPQRTKGFDDRFHFLQILLSQDKRGECLLEYNRSFGSFLTLILEGGRVRLSICLSNSQGGARSRPEDLFLTTFDPAGHFLRFLFAGICRVFARRPDILVLSKRIIRSPATPLFRTSPSPGIELLTPLASTPRWR